MSETLIGVLGIAALFFFLFARMPVGMALLVHRSFTDEEANGVALTANPFDTTGFEPGFRVVTVDGIPRSVPQRGRQAQRIRNARPT